MSKPIKATPILTGKDAKRFLKAITENEKRDHSKAFARAQAAFQAFTTQYDNDRFGCPIALPSEYSCVVCSDRLRRPDDITGLGWIKLVATWCEGHRKLHNFKS